MKEGIEKRMREEYQVLYDDRYEWLDEDDESADALEHWKNLLLDEAEVNIQNRYHDYINMSLEMDMLTNEEAEELKQLNDELWSYLEDLLLEEMPDDEDEDEAMELTA